MATPTAITRFTPVFKPLTNITPFTFRDAYTFADLYERLRSFLEETLTPEIDAKLTLVYDEVQAQVLALAEDVNASKDAWQALFDEFMAGISGHIAVLNDEAVASLVLGALTDTRAALNTVVVMKDTQAINVLDHGVIGDGIADDTAAINATIAIASKAPLLFPPGKTFKISGTLEFGDRRVIAHGATFVQYANLTAVRFANTNIPVTAVTGYTRKFFQDGDVWREETEIYCSTVTGVKEGSVVKLVSEEIIASARKGDGINESRQGEFFTVVSVGGNGLVVTVQGAPRYTHTTNIRMANMSSRTTRAGMEGGVVAFNTVQGMSASAIIFSGLNAPYLKDVTVEKTPGSGVQFYGCYGHRVSNFMVNNAVDNTAAGSYGYGILDVSGAEFSVSGFTAHAVRHAYTDDSGRVPVGGDVIMYGSSYKGKINNSHALGTHSAAWDTHAASEGIEFHGCSATQCQTGFNLRGVGHSIFNGTTWGGENGLAIIDENAGAHSYGHMIDGMQIIKPTRAPVKDFHRGPTHTTHANVRDDRPNYMRNVTVQTGKSSQEMFMVAARSTWIIDGVTVIMSAVIPADAKVFRSVNAEMIVRNVFIDAEKAAPTASGWNIVRSEENSDIDIDAVKIRIPFFSAGTACHPISLDDATKAAQIRVVGVETTHPTGDHQGLAVKTPQPIYEHVALSNGTNSETVVTTAPTTGVAALVSRTEKDLVIQVNIGATATLEKFNPGKYPGRIVTIFNRGSAALTVTHDPTIMRLVGELDKTVSVGQCIRMVWLGDVWQQIKDI